MKDRPTVYACVDIKDGFTIVIFWEKKDADDWVQQNNDIYNAYEVETFEVQ